MAENERFTIEEVEPTGKPYAPKRSRYTFINQCGVVVRDNVPINIQEWNKKKDDAVSYVEDRSKDEIWNSLMINFTLPPEEDQNNPVIRRKVKIWDLMKMAEQFKNWKKKIEWPVFPARQDSRIHQSI